MMDEETIEVYNREAASTARLHSTLKPERIYQLSHQYFIKGGKTLDVGCGIGRDTHWLNQQGFPTLGIDASVEMLKFAQRFYSSADFLLDSLPDLKKIGLLRFQNILCSAVLMHLPETQIPIACQRLLALLETDGRLIISIRGTQAESQRERGKLYAPIDPESLQQLFIESGAKVLFQETTTEPARSLNWHNLVIHGDK
jgi:2-polyprenyl-3-methyl-5-hydroxy-6-metoxy-1,4-benzoquinol methylase